MWEFSPGVSVPLPVGYTPLAVVLADVNGDGTLDIVVANTGSNSISVILGDGRGGFSPKVDFATGIAPRSVVIADVNDDGFPDLIVANSGLNSVSVLLGDGSGGFSPRIDTAVGSAPYSVAVADLNGDGRADIAVANSGDNSISVRMGSGNGAFAGGVDLASGSSPSSVVIGDVNGDGRPDIITANYASNSITEYIGNGVGAFSGRADFATGGGPVSLAFGDLNQDGFPDLVTGDYDVDQITVLLGDGAGDFSSRRDYDTNRHPRSVTIADVNLDGMPDVAVACLSSGTVSIHYGDALGILLGHVDWPAGSGPEAVAVGDMNGDGFADLAVACFSSGTVNVELSFAATTFTLPTTYPVNNATSQIYATAVGDVNGDAVPDLLMTRFDQGQLAVVPGDGNGGLLPPTYTPIDPAPSALAFADMNGDGHPDLVVSCHYCSYVEVYLADGNGHLARKGGYGEGVYPPMVLADMNHDGHLDVLGLASFQNQPTNGVYQMLGDGTGALGPAQTIAIPPTSWATLADINADGIPDIITVHGYPDTISVQLADGSGGFGGRVDTPTNHLDQGTLFAGDFNGDGRNDLILEHGKNDSLTMFIGDGAGHFLEQNSFAAIADDLQGPTAVADMNGDGRPDLLIGIPIPSSTIPFELFLYLGDGTGKFGPPVPMATIGRPVEIPSTQDLNGDGRPDLMSLNFDIVSGTYSAAVRLSRTPTRIGLVCSDTSQQLGGTVTLTASVSAVPPAVRNPHGIVHFFDGTTLIGSAQVISGLASISVPARCLGIRRLSAAYDPRDDETLLRASSASRSLSVFAPVAPTVDRIRDMPADQGGLVALRFFASRFDIAGADTAVTSYTVYRNKSHVLARPAPNTGQFVPRGRSVATLSGVIPTDWGSVGEFPATGQGSYKVVVPTNADTGCAGQLPTAFFVRATLASGLSYDSAPISGWSVDNIAPAVPDSLAGAYLSGATHLTWRANSESDLAGYRVYRDNSPGFVPSQLNFIAATPDTEYSDPSGAGMYYRVTATDASCNEGESALLSPDMTLSANGGPTLAFALESARPNPASDAHLNVSFTLPNSSSAMIALIDATGRRVVEQPLASFGAGRHVIDVLAGHMVPPGFYFVRLTQGSSAASCRVVVLK